MTADELFQTALHRRSLKFTLTDEGLYLVQIGDVSATINLENVRRNYARDKDSEAVERFAHHLDSNVFEAQPTWESVIGLLRYSLEPSDYIMGFDDVLHQEITSRLVKVFVYTSPDGSEISWVTHGMVADWGRSEAEVRAAANSNMDNLVHLTKLEVQAAGEVKLGMLALQDISFKASLILSPKFKELVSSVHGWPVYVVVPARDFVYILARSHRDFLARLGGVVLQEYHDSGHPITPDVLEVGDDGVTAIGSFAQREE